MLDRFILKLNVLLLIMFFVPSVKILAQESESISITQDGKFVIGCNYWASHAGTNMWNDWRKDVVESDLKQMSDAGIQVIRVFLNWPDFQPIYQFYSANGSLKEIRFKEHPLSKTGPGKDGVSVEALEHFQQLADISQKYKIKLVVGLVTGWMSGRLFVPSALEGRDILSDPISIMWQVKLVRNVVHEFKGHPAILAWDLGNECNVMGVVSNYQAAYVWTASLSNAIKAEDKSHPVVSGMSGLSSDNQAKWRIQDQSELTDVLTIHPYPFWVPHGNKDPANTIRTLALSSAGNCFYEDIGGKPCFVEETGIMGPMEANEKIKAGFLRANLFSNWANNCHGLLWWCAYDQNQLTFPPYEWYAVERDLGLFRNDRSAKPVVHELSVFRNFLDGLPFKSLPLRKKEAVCILTDGQDQWGVAYSTFILAKQAGFDIEFQSGDQPLKEAPLYILPSIRGLTLIDREDWLKILDKVKEGAILYVSFDKGFLSPFVEPAGIEIVSSNQRTGKASFVSTDGKIKTFMMDAERKMSIMPKSAQVLAHEDDGNPVFTVNSYGKGKIYFLGFPMETDLTNQPGSFDTTSAECWKIYETISREVVAKNRAVTKDDPFVGITEHDLSADKKVVILLNYSPDDRNVKLFFHTDWRVEKAFYGDLPLKSSVAIKANDACVLLLRN